MHVTCPTDLAMYSDAVKVVGADFQVADLTALIERAWSPPWRCERQSTDRFE